MRLRLILILLSLLFLSYQSIYSQIISLKHRMDYAQFIIEGKVVDAQSYFGDDGMVYTANKVKLYKVFKGVPQEEYVTVITFGGEVDGHDYDYTELLRLHKGDIGIFLLTTTGRPYPEGPDFPHERYEVYSSLQGFFKYDFEYDQEKEAQWNSAFIKEFGAPIIVNEFDWQHHFSDQACLVYTFELSQPDLSNPFELEAVISVKANIGQFHLYQSSIISTFSTAVLGESLVQNGNIQLTPSEAPTLSNYDIQMEDLARDKFEAQLRAKITDKASMFLVTEDFKELVKVKLNVQELGDPELFISSAEMRAKNKYYDHDLGTVEDITCVLVEGDFSADCLCTDPPVIESFEPEIISAGTGDVLTIRGECFGDSSAFVHTYIEFTNARSGPKPVQWVKQNANKVIAWSDTLIKLEVPSRVIFEREFNITNNAGTGFFRINKDCGPASIGLSRKPLTITYSAINNVTLRSGSPIACGTPVYLGNYNNAGGQSIVYGPKFKAYPGATAAFERALVKWRCATGINYVIQDAQDFDDFSEVGVVEMQALSPNMAGFTINNPDNGFVLCDSAGNTVTNRVAFIIGFNENVVWHTDVSTPPLDKTMPIDTADLESTALHELGHAHLLNHSNDSTDLMFYRKRVGVEYRREITTHALAGGNHIMEISTQQASPFCRDRMIAVTSNCEVVSDVIDLAGYGPIEIDLSPNPTRTNLTVELKSLPNANLLELTWSLSDLNGQTISRGQLDRINTLDFEHLPNGIYLLSVLSKERFIKTFKVVKQE